MCGSMPPMIGPQDSERDEDGLPAWGFVGTGEITAAIVEGLHAADVDPPAIFLSPRGRDVGQELAARLPRVHVCGSNQEVVDSASTVVLAVRPETAHTVLTELTWQPRHLLLSAVAGVRLQQLREWAAPAGDVVRVIPLPQAARGQSLTAAYPGHAAAAHLFERVGDVLVPADEAALEAISAATATFAAHLDYLGTIADWLAEQGVDRRSARGFVTHVFGQLGRSLLEQSDSLDVLTGKHRTAGGINEQVATDLRSAGVPESVRGALDRVLERLRGRPVA